MYLGGDWTPGSPFANIGTFLLPRGSGLFIQVVDDCDSSDMTRWRLTASYAVERSGALLDLRRVVGRTTLRIASHVGRVTYLGDDGRLQKGAAVGKCRRCARQLQRGDKVEALADACNQGLTRIPGFMFGAALPFL